MSRDTDFRREIQNLENWFSGSVVRTMEMIAKVRKRKGRLGKTNIEGERDLMRI